MSFPTPLKHADPLPHQRIIAMRAAWLSYLFLLVLPLMLFATLFAAYSHTVTPPAPSHAPDAWFLLATAFLAVGVPAALFYRRHLCGEYHRGGVVAPRQYFAGMLTVWMALQIGVILPIVGCYVTASFLPMLLPAIVAFVFFITQWPAGRMMIGHTGNSEDPEIYKQPR